MENQDAVELIVLACLLAAGGGLALLLARRGIGWLLTLLPPQRRRAVPWGAGEVIWAVGVMVFGSVGLLALLLSVDAFDPLYGQGFSRQALAGGEGAGKLLQRCLPWAVLAALPLQVAAIVVVMRLTYGAQLYQLGLTTHRLARNLRLGVLVWLVVTPPILLINALLVSWLRGLDLVPESHQVEELAKQIQFSAEWVVLALLAIVAAPVLEELVFRGVLQPWSMRAPWAADLTLAGSLAIVLTERGFKLAEAARDGAPIDFAYELQPLIFVGLMAIPYAVLRIRHASPPHLAIYAVALLFAMFHAGVWPSPIALLPLGLVLGWLAYRTQSLAASMTLHGLFNAVSVVVLVLAYGMGEEGSPVKAKSVCNISNSGVVRPIQAASVSSILADVPLSLLDGGRSHAPVSTCRHPAAGLGRLGASPRPVDSRRQEAATTCDGQPPGGHQHRRPGDHHQGGTDVP